MAATEGTDPSLPVARLVIGIVQGKVEFRAAIIEFRKEAGLSQLEVSRRIGVRPATISTFETGTSDLRLSSMEKIFPL